MSGFPIQISKVYNYHFPYQADIGFLRVFDNSFLPTVLTIRKGTAVIPFLKIKVLV